MTTENLKNFFEEKDFIVHLIEQDGNQCAEVETWTNGGVNMILWLNPFSIEEFKQRVDDFDVDEDFHSRLKDVLSELQVY